MSPVSFSPLSNHAVLGVQQGCVKGRVQVGLLSGARCLKLRPQRLPDICSLAAASHTSAGELPGPARPQALLLPHLAWSECLAQPLHVLRGCQRILFGCDLEQSCMEDCTGFQRGRQGGPYCGGVAGSRKPSPFPCSHLRSSSQGSPP